MSIQPEFVDATLGWYIEKVRPFLESTEGASLVAFDQEMDRLTKLAKAPRPEVPVCILGQSGVGKSTLLNTIVAERLSILPQGGIGPLTAQATVVRYATDPYYRASYLSFRLLNRLLFALERAFDRTASLRSDAVDDPELLLTPDDREEMADDDSIPQGETSGDDRQEAYKRQARLMVQGAQYGDLDLPYLIDGVRAALGLASRHGRTLSDQDLARVEQLRHVINESRAGNGTLEKLAGPDLPGFLTSLADHASGFLAPMIKTLEVGWDANVLKDGLVLVDLPGVGVANDEYRRVTAEWIRKARAILMVVERAGVTEAAGEMLQSTGFLNALLHDSYDADAEPFSLMVAVVKLDLVASDERIAARQQRPGSERRWIEYFDELCDRAVHLIKGQMRALLERLVADSPDAAREETQQAVARVLETLQVHPVCAPEYRKLLENDDEDRPKICELAESRVPQLGDAFRSVAIARTERRQKHVWSISENLRDRLVAAVERTRAHWEAEARTEEEAARVRADLDEVMAPLRREFDVRHGAFREFLRATVPAEIEARVAAASLEAATDIKRYLKRFDSYHWATLRAAVRKGGSYDGARNVNLPHELTLRFESPIAVVWSKHVLLLLRSRTSALGDDYVQLVGEVVTWARAQGARVQPKRVEEFHKALQSEIRALQGVGREAVDELRDRVKTQLYADLEERIRKKCAKFVEDKRDVGVGVKQRILDLIRDELTDVVVDAARPVATRVLTQNYQEVSKEIDQALGRFRKPHLLERTADEIVSAHEASVRRSDAQKKRRVLADAEAVLAAAPARTSSDAPSEAS